MNSLHQRGIARTQLIVLVSVLLAVIILIPVAYALLHDSRTPVRKASDTFMNALAKDDATTTYSMFTSRLKKQVSRTSWRQQVDSSFKHYVGKPKFISTSAIVDPYHVYKSGTDPTNMIYQFTVSDKHYNMTIVLLQTGTSKTPLWQVDEWETRLQ